jgi:predicted lipid-binding transport protein (Tim44 family)
MFSASFLFASLLWGSVGFGYFIYGKKQQSLSPMVGGILMIIVSYFVGSALLMSLVCLGIGGAVYFLARRGIENQRQPEFACDFASHRSSTPGIIVRVTQPSTPLLVT